MKKLLPHLLLALLVVGCDADNIFYNGECEPSADYHLEVSAPSLQIDENGYYHIEWLEGNNQTFSTLDANTGVESKTYKVMWESDSGINYNGYWVSSVNPASYTNDGVAHTVLSVWEEQIGDTITIQARYSIDECYSYGITEEYIDSIKVVVDNKIQNP